MNEHGDFKKMTDKPDYSKTINMPHERLPMRADLTNKEPAILEKWNSIDIYDKIQQKNKNKPVYILHDGPPYANGDIHIGHALNKILKDIIIKYKTLCGYRSPYVPGWDCHGLPVELNVMKQIKDSNEDISNAVIRKQCREYAIKYVEIQKKQFKRLGIFADWNNPYLTITTRYESSIIRAFGRLVEGGYIYRGKKPIHWCPTCQTALAASTAESEYAEHVSDAITVAFQSKEDKNLYIVIWTTTPWTLPANVAVCVRGDLDYVIVEVNNKRYILAERLLILTMFDIGWENYRILDRVKGADLEGKIFRHPFIDREAPVVLGDFVTTEDGTGVVHIAPGHGQEDYEVGLKYGLPIIAPVDERGCFTKEAQVFQGVNVFEANEGIVKLLQDKGVLLHHSKISHQYPHCWRCKKPIIFRATYQWFMSIDKKINESDNTTLRDLCIETALKNIEWIPYWGKDRFLGTIRERPDWCLSRQRNWGVPIPALHCKDCGEPLLNYDFIEDVAVAVEKYGNVDVWFNKDIAEISSRKLLCKKCGGTSFKKETDILDVWFDSGTSWFAVLKQRDNLSFPADLYLEGSDQHRGWFQASLIPSMALEKISPYKTVLTHGFMLDKEGKAMHKSAGNAISPFEIIDKYGADILRLWVSSEDYSEDLPISFDILKRVSEVYRKIRNTCKFLVDAVYDFNPVTDMVNDSSLEFIDKMMLNTHQSVINQISSHYDKFQFHSVYHILNKYCTVDLSAEYCVWIKDRLYCEPANSPTRRAVQTVLYKILKSILIVASPILSFTSEDIRNYLFKNDEGSIFLEDWPRISDVTVVPLWTKLLNFKNEVFKAVEKAKDSNIIHRPEAACVIIVASQEKLEPLKKCADVLKTITMVAEINFSTASSSDATLLHKADDISFYVKSTSYQKCPRCWKFDPSMSDAVDVCERCNNVLKEVKL